MTSATLARIIRRMPRMPTPDISRMGYNPANFAYRIGTSPWVAGYSVYYAISFYDAVTDTESARSAWWGPKTDPKKLYGGFGLIRIPVDHTGRRRRGESGESSRASRSG